MSQGNVEGKTLSSYAYEDDLWNGLNKQRDFPETVSIILNIRNLRIRYFDMGSNKSIALSHLGEIVST